MKLKCITLHQNDNTAQYITDTKENKHFCYVSKVMKALHQWDNQESISSFKKESPISDMDNA